VLRTDEVGPDVARLVVDVEQGAQGAARVVAGAEAAQDVLVVAQVERRGVKGGEQRLDAAGAALAARGRVQRGGHGRLLRGGGRRGRGAPGDRHALSDRFTEPGVAELAGGCAPLHRRSGGL
jgi:hypothetical protein